MGTQCLLCQQAEATKTNSHIIPSFIVSKVCNYDGSRGRDKEVIFTISPYQESLYLGRSVSIDKVNELFDNISEEQIKSVKDNSVAQDFILCPHCEENIGKYLETPYATYIRANKKNDKDHIAYFFWVSIVWRIAISKQFGISLPQSIINNLRECLFQYLQNKEIEISACNFSYKLLYVSQYFQEKLSPSFMNGKYFQEDNLLMLVLGDLIICATFSREDFSINASYFGIEKLFVNMPLNNGNTPEEYNEISTTDWEPCMEIVKEEIAKRKITEERELANTMWTKIELNGEMPQDMFCEFLEMKYASETKLGTTISPEHYVSLYKQVLDKHGYMEKE